MTPFKLLVLGNIRSGKSTFAQALANELTCPVFGIDLSRIAYGDGTPAGEARAWASFLEDAERRESGILECTGGGPFASLFRLALNRSSCRWAVLFVATPAVDCLERVRICGLNAPYPNFDIPIDRVIPAVELGLENELTERWPALLAEIDGTKPTRDEIFRLWPVISAWLEETSLDVL